MTAVWRSPAGEQTGQSCGHHFKPRRESQAGI